MSILGQAPSKTSLYNKRKMERQELLEWQAKKTPICFMLKQVGIKALFSRRHIEFRAVVI